MRMLNLGIVAHVDAGKTSLTERLLFDAGAISTMGAVDDGDTQTDTMGLERRRGITIRSSVATFVTGEHEVHLIDTPGHVDFIAEVERALGVLDGAILVVSAVEGVQTQTRRLMRALTAMAVPTLLFVNKIDRPGARGDADLMADIHRMLSRSAIAMSSLSGIGTPSATAARRELDTPFADELTELLAAHSDSVLESYLYTPDSLDRTRLRDELSTQARAALVHPVLFGSARTGSGIDALRAAITEFLPSAGGGDGQLAGTVFAIERDGQGDRSAVVRLFSGSLGTRDVVTFSHRDPTGTVVEKSGKVTRVRAAAGWPGRVSAGGIAWVTGLRGIRIGDHLGSTTPRRALPHFRPPTLETVVTARSAADTPALFTALSELAEQDPLIDVRRGAQHGSFLVSLYGEVQREVIDERLAEEFGIEADFSPPRIVCVEKPAGIGMALEKIGEGDRTCFWATVGLRIEPGTPGTEAEFRLEVERGSLPPAFLKAIEETVHSTLREGLHGWQVTDYVVTLTHTGYASPVSTAADFRNLTPLVLMAALSRATTVVCEPLERVELELPENALSPALVALTQSGGLPDKPVLRGESYSLEAVLPTARLREFERRLPGITGGSGVLTARFERYQEIGGHAPTRPRTDHNPLDREEYLLHVLGKTERPHG